MGRVNPDMKPELALPEISTEEVVLLFGNCVNKLLGKDRLQTWQGWMGPKFDLVVIRDLPQEPIDVNHTRFVVGVNGDYRRVTDKALKESLPELAEAWGCNLNGKPSTITYKHRGNIIKEVSFDSASLPPVSLVFKNRFSGSDGKLYGEDLVLRRFFYKITPGGYITYGSRAPFLAIPHIIG